VTSRTNSRSEHGQTRGRAVLYLPIGAASDHEDLIEHLRRSFSQFTVEASTDDREPSLYDCDRSQLFVGERALRALFGLV
jgi:hypothetical protein